MITHMLKEQKTRSEYTTRCGQVLSRNAKRDGDHRPTIWESEVTCTKCAVSAKEILVGPLALSNQGDDNYIINNSEQQRSTTNKGTSTMARNTQVEETTSESEASPEATPTETPAAAKAPKKEKAPLPEGFVTPVQFNHLLNARDKENGLPGDGRPQIIYGYVKNSKTFPHQKNTDGAVIVNRDEAFKFIDELRARKAQREADKAAKAAAPAEEAAS
jgi:hypothetical protein